MDDRQESCSATIGKIAANFIGADIAVVGVHFSTANKFDTPSPRINVLVNEGANLVLRNSVISDVLYTAHASPLALLPRSSVTQVQAKWNKCDQTPFIGGVISILGGGSPPPNKAWMPGASVDVKSADLIQFASNIIAGAGDPAIHLSGIARAQIDSLVVTNMMGQVINSTPPFCCVVHCITDLQECNTGTDPQ